MQLFKYLTLALLLSTPALAVEPSKTSEKPVCGKTVEECQKSFDTLQGSLKTLQAAVQGATQQRDQMTKMYNDLQLQDFVKNTLTQQ